MTDRGRDDEDIALSILRILAGERHEYKRLDWDGDGSEGGWITLDGNWPVTGTQVDFLRRLGFGPDEVAKAGGRP